jgi:hypothetical protein
MGGSNFGEFLSLQICTHGSFLRVEIWSEKERDIIMHITNNRHDTCEDHWSWRKGSEIFSRLQ